MEISSGAEGTSQVREGIGAARPAPRHLEDPAQAVRCMEGRSTVQLFTAVHKRKKKPSRAYVMSFCVRKEECSTHSHGMV